MRSTVPGSLEEDWFFQALMECYLPILNVLENSFLAKDQNPKITISLSPTLLSLLNDDDLKRRFPEWLNVRLNLLKNVRKDQKEAADFLYETINIQLASFHACEGNLIERFSNLQKSKVIDILT